MTSEVLRLPNLKELALVGLCFGLPQIVQRRPDFCPYEQGILAFEDVRREQSRASDERPSEDVIKDRLVAKVRAIDVLGTQRRKAASCSCCHVTYSEVLTRLICPKPQAISPTLV